MSPAAQSPILLGVRPPLSFISGVLHGRLLYAAAFERDSVPETEPCDETRARLSVLNLEGTDEWEGLGETTRHLFLRSGAAPGTLLDVRSTTLEIADVGAPLVDQPRWSTTRWWLDLEGGFSASEPVADESLLGLAICGACDLFTKASDDGLSFDAVAHCSEKTAP